MVSFESWSVIMPSYIPSLKYLPPVLFSDASCSELREFIVIL
jgi:hypothetical protein